MSKITFRAAALAAILVAAACGPTATTASPSPSTAAASRSATATPAPSATATATATSTAAATVSGSPRAEPTPVALTVSGHVTRASDARPVADVRLRFLPADLAGGCPVACPQAPGPNVVVTSDANGAYSGKIMVWTLEALANSSSSQLNLFVTPPAGMKIVAITQSSTLPIGPLAPNVPEWWFMLERQITGPIDITLAPQ